MMNIKSIILSSLFLLSSTVMAENHMLIIGGGGEPAGPETIFDKTMEMFGDNLSKSNWKYQMSFNGGHAATEAIIAKKYSKAQTPVTSFTEDAYIKMINEYKAKIIKGEIKSGDQLVIMVNSHGASADKNSGKTHQISVTGGTATDLNSLKGSKTVSLNMLEDIVKLTTDKGIKLGIIDLSCHSGSTQALKANAPNTCIITATGPKHYAFAGEWAFSGRLAKNLTKGTTLENAFLKARADSVDASFPMISTDENDQIVAEVYSAITPYLYYYDPKADKISDYIINNSKDCVTCTRDIQFKSLIDKINKLQAAAQGTNTDFNAEELKKLLTEYKTQQDDIIKKQVALGVAMLDKKETFIGETTIQVKGKPKVIKFQLNNHSWEDIIRAEPDEVIKSITKSSATDRTPEEKANTLAALDSWKQLRKKQTEIMFQYPELKEARAAGKKIILSIGENRKTAEKIALQEKKLYDELYRQKQSLNTDDPCRRIVF